MDVLRLNTVLEHRASYKLEAGRVMELKLKVTGKVECRGTNPPDAVRKSHQLDIPSRHSRLNSLTHERRPLTVLIFKELPWIVNPHGNPSKIHTAFRQLRKLD